MTEPATTRKLVVFLCADNATRSQMAQAFARMHGAEQVQAFSASVTPSGKIDPQAIDAMQELGYDLQRHRSKNVMELVDTEFDLAVAMGVDECPYVRTKRWLKWNIPDPGVMSPEQFRQIRDLIELKVKDLLRTL
jgi:protein-tyrosine-phosphatase